MTASDAAAIPSPPLPAPAATSRRVLRLVVQAGGFAVGIGLLWWCATVALKPENRAALERLHHAPPRTVLALAALAALTVAINGQIFRETLRPVRTLRTRDAQAVNVVATLLGCLPFKISLLFRILVHSRRDGVPLLTIGAWIGALAAVMAAVYGPLVMVSLWRPRVDLVWAVAVLGGVAACVGALLAAARAMKSDRGWSVVERAWAAVPVLGRRPSLLARAHEGVRMLADPRAVLTAAALRLADAGVNAARFAVAASILAYPLGWDRCVLAGAVYFLVGAAAPAGQLGTREAATAASLSQTLGVDRDGLVLVVLLVTAVEAAVLLVGAAAGLAWLRLSRRSHETLRPTGPIPTTTEPRPSGSG